MEYKWPNSWNRWGGGSPTNAYGYRVSEVESTRKFDEDNTSTHSIEDKENINAIEQDPSVSSAMRWEESSDDDLGFEAPATVARSVEEDPAVQQQGSWQEDSADEAQLTVLASVGGERGVLEEDPTVQHPSLGATPESGSDDEEPVLNSVQNKRLADREKLEDENTKPIMLIAVSSEIPELVQGKTTQSGTVKKVWDIDIPVNTEFLAPAPVPVPVPVVYDGLPLVYTNRVHTSHAPLVGPKLHAGKVIVLNAIKVHVMRRTRVC
jgi:hypothetical protein